MIIGIISKSNAQIYQPRKADMERTSVVAEAAVDVGRAVEVVLIDPPGLVVQIWLMSLSVHFQICTWLALARLPSVRSRQKPWKPCQILWRVRQMHYHTLIVQSDSVIVSVKPILSWKVIKTLPDFHSNAIYRVRASVETETCPTKYDRALARINVPILRRGTIAVETIWQVMSLAETILIENAHLWTGVPFWKMLPRTSRHFVVFLIGWSKDDAEVVDMKGADVIVAAKAVILLKTPEVSESNGFIIDDEVWWSCPYQQNSRSWPWMRRGHRPIYRTACCRAG